MAIGGPAGLAYPTVGFVVLEAYGAAAGIDHPKNVVLVDGRDPFPVGRDGHGTDDRLRMLRKLFRGRAAVGAHAPDLVFAAFIAEHGEVLVVNELRQLVPDAATPVGLHPAVAFCRRDEEPSSTDHDRVIAVGGEIAIRD